MPSQYWGCVMKVQGREGKCRNEVVGGGAGN